MPRIVEPLGKDRSRKMGILESTPSSDMLAHRPERRNGRTADVNLSFNTTCIEYNRSACCARRFRRRLHSLQTIAIAADLEQTIRMLVPNLLEPTWLKRQERRQPKMKPSAFLLAIVVILEFMCSESPAVCTYRSTACSSSRAVCS